MLEMQISLIVIKMFEWAILNVLLSKIVLENCRVKCRAQISLLFILCIILFVTNKKIIFFFLFMTENSNWCHRLCSLDFPTNGYLAHNYGTKSPITCLPIRCCHVAAKSLIALLNGSLERSGIDTRRAVCALSSTKHMSEQTERSSTEINMPSE